MVEECSLSLCGLASLLSSVRRLCDQAREWAPTGRARHLIPPPILPFLSMGCHLLPQGKNPLSLGNPHLGSSAAGEQHRGFCMAAPEAALLQKNLSWSYAKPSRDLGEGEGPHLQGARLMTNVTQLFNNIPFFFIIIF